MNQTLALIGIVVGLLIAGYMDGQDQAMTEKSSAVAYSMTNQGKQLACIDCAGGVK